MHGRSTTTKKGNPQTRIKITTVLIAVARSVSTPLIPILAKMAVSAAKKAASKAYIHHIIFHFSMNDLLFEMHVR